MLPPALVALCCVAVLCTGVCYQERGGIKANRKHWACHGTGRARSCTWGGRNAGLLGWISCRSTGCVTLALPENQFLTRQFLCPFTCNKCRAKQVESRDLNRAAETCQFSPPHEVYRFGGFFIPGTFKIVLGKLSTLSMFPWQSGIISHVLT